MEELPKRPRKDLGGLAHGLQFGLTVIGFLFAGYWLDQRGTLPAPLGTLGGLMLGAVLGMYLLAKATSGGGKGDPKP